ncbi:MAG: phosphate ABC transporter permease subunit PstC [Roseiflexaceae bacterium]
MRQRNAIFIQSVFFSAAALLVLSTLALVTFIGSAGLQVFSFLSPIEFFFGTTWDQNSQTFGVLPLLYGSAITTVITLLISAPLAIATAIFMVEIAPPRIRRVMRTVVELFAALPSVIFGLLGLTIIVPWVRDTFHTGLGKGIFAASIVLVFMTQPTIVSIAEDTLRALPESLREGALAAGATRWQMIWRVLLPAARSGVITAIILGMGRAIGETMAVQMVIGNITARIPNGLVTGATTMPAAIVTQLPEATSPEHRAALIMVAFLLLIITLILIATVRLTTGGQRAGTRSRKTTLSASRTIAAASIKQGDA